MATKSEKTVVVPLTTPAIDISSLIYKIRGNQVMLDQDFAVLYGYEVRALNQQVKRNIGRFPADFMFQLTKAEVEVVKSQIVTSPDSTFFTGQEGGRRKLPHAFTEQGIYMLATVLKGEIAEKQSIFIMRAFREMRHYIQQNHQFVTKKDLKLLEAETRRISGRQDEADAQIGRPIPHSFTARCSFRSMRSMISLKLYTGSEMSMILEISSGNFN